MSRKTQEIINLSRDCMASMVPSGARILLHAGTEVVIVQDRGGSYTVNVYGNLARIEAHEADALGKEVHDPLQDLPADASLQDKIKVQLKTCYDPEISLNIMELGLIYNCMTKEDSAHTGHYLITIIMTLTSPGCGMGDVIADEVKKKIEAIAEVTSCEMAIVFDPPWEREMMSESARLQLGML